MKDKSNDNRAGRTLIICGASGTGKTRVFLDLVAGREHSISTETLKSTEANSAFSHDINGQVIDIPGDYTLRQDAFEKACKGSLSADLAFFVGTELDPADAEFLASVLLKLLSSQRSRLFVFGDRDKVGVGLRDCLGKILARTNGITGIADLSRNEQKTPDLILLAQELDIEDSPERFQFELVKNEIVFYDYTKDFQGAAEKLRCI